MDHVSVDIVQVLEPVELTATGLHGRILFRSGAQAGAVWFCLGDKLLVTPSSSDRRPVGAASLEPLTELHIRQLQLVGVLEAYRAEATCAWI